MLWISESVTLDLVSCKAKLAVVSVLKIGNWKFVRCCQTITLTDFIAIQTQLNYAATRSITVGGYSCWCSGSSLFIFMSLTLVEEVVKQTVVTRIMYGQLHCDIVINAIFLFCCRISSDQINLRSQRNPKMQQTRSCIHTNHHFPAAPFYFNICWSIVSLFIPVTLKNIQI